MAVNTNDPDYNKLKEAMLGIARYYAEHGNFKGINSDSAYIRQIRGLKEAQTIGLEYFVSEFVGALDGKKK